MRAICGFFGGMAAVVVAAGCGSEGGKYVPVSGVLKVNGHPYPNAAVRFQPVGDKGNPNPGRGSYALTDAQGKFVLKYDGGDGAVVGTHQVVFRTDDGSSAAPIDPNTGSADNVPAPAKGKVDPIPADWRSSSDKHTFEVPAGGTDQANFEITSPVPWPAKK